MARDWLKDLWRASYKGASFWTERDQESGGRRVVKHQFPMRDDPFLEDLGEDLREFDLTAYVASDTADVDASALVAACASRGPGLLVMPVQGPVLVRCISFSRDSSKDRAGYIGFNLKCCRDGASSALISAAMAANLVFVAAETAAVTMAAYFAAGLQVKGRPDYVVEAAAADVQGAIAAFEAVRSTEPVEVGASATQRASIEQLFDQVPDLLNGGSEGATIIAARLIDIARGLGDALPAISAVRAFDAVITEPAFASAIGPGAVYATEGRRIVAENADLANRLLRLAAITAYCEAIARVKLSDRPAGITLRANVAEYFEAEVSGLSASDIDLVNQIGKLRDATITYLSRVILDLAPVLQLEANQSMPSLYWAYRLYQDPRRSVELVARNRVVHPSFMPAAFEALAR